MVKLSGLKYFLQTGHIRFIKQMLLYQCHVRITNCFYHIQLFTLLIVKVSSFRIMLIKEMPLFKQDGPLSFGVEGQNCMTQVLKLHCVQHFTHYHVIQTFLLVTPLQLFKILCRYFLISDEFKGPVPSSNS